MKRTLYILTAMLLAAQPAPAAEFGSWLQERGKSAEAAAEPSDGAQLVTLEPGENELFPRISPNGNKLMVMVEKGKEQWLATRFANNGDPLALVNRDPQSLLSARWSDADHFSFQSDRASGVGLWVVAGDGQGLIRRAQELHGNVVQAVLLPDESATIAVRLTSEGQSPGTNRSTALDLRDISGAQRFNTWEFKGYRGYVVRIGRDGSEKVLAEGVNPAISPDGKRVLFSMPVGRSNHLYMVDVDGSNLTQLTSDRCNDVQPAWSRDGKWVVFASNRGEIDIRDPNAKANNWDIWAIGADGRNLIQLTRNKAHDGAPDVGTDGKVYFHSDREVTREQRQERQVATAVRGFHIWTVDLPKN